ncbi:hypothetical protein N7493_006785 [Penicillium malachiteum]|uniref:Uncharacterized protein n=1 Tax=Penicillium malachiteum TaxID=1324776 RepID=A0AAD6MUW6_9EURO|nr:hypothetical protein N7493_006785 [Penicillium malachiteum]
MSTYFHTEYRKFLANPRSAKVATNVSLLYVASTTKFEGSDSVLTHLSRQSGIVKKKSEQIINAIESSDSLVLDIETTLEFLEGGGAYLPSFDDNFLADRVVTIPTLHIVHWNAEQEIQQVRIYWDQGSLLKEVEVIGARSRSWPIRAAQEQTRLLRSAAAAKSATAPELPLQNGTKEPAARPGSPGKRRIKDPYAADSLYDLLSPNKADAENESVAPHPYAAESLTELLSPSKASPEPVRPYAPSAVKPPTRDLSDLFIDDEAPATPSKPERVIAPKAGTGKAQVNRIFSQEDSLDQDRAPYKSNPKRFNHFELGADNSELEEKDVGTPKSGAGKPQVNRIFSQEDNLDQDRAAYKSNPHRFSHFQIGDDDSEAGGNLDKDRAAYKSNPHRFSHFQIGDDDSEAGGNLDKDRAAYKSNPHRFNHFQIGDDETDPATPKKSSAPLSEQARNFGYSDTAEVDTPPARNHVFKPRRDADVHFEMNDEKQDEEPRPFAVVGSNANRRKDFDPHWEMNDEENGIETENKPIPSDRMKAIKMMESHWDPYDPESPGPRPTMTALHNPLLHNQPSWGFGDE